MPRVVLSTVMVLWLASPGWAAFIKAGDHLVPAVSGVTIDVVGWSTSGETANGANLWFEIVPLVGSPAGTPLITEARLDQPGYFFSSAGIQTVFSDPPATIAGAGAFDGTKMSIPSATGSKLARVTLDTSGLSPGTWGFNMGVTGDVNKQSNYLGTSTDTSFFTGTITVTAEPGILTMLAGLVGGGLLWFRPRRRRSARVSHRSARVS